MEDLPAGTLFRTAEVPGRSRGAVHAFLSREVSKPPELALCDRLGADLYWIPLRDHFGYPKYPAFNDVMEKAVGSGFGVAGHAAGCATGWLSHQTEPLLQVAAVGSPPATRPLPYVIIRRRSNRSRLDLKPIEVAYLEAVAAFDECAEVDWEHALRITAKRTEHHGVVRPSLLLETTKAERCKNVALVRRRMAELCGVLDGTVTPKPAPVLETCPSARLLEARHLTWLMEAGDGYRKRTVPISQFVKNWANRPEERSAMCEQEPASPNRLDLVRIAATVHALCDRDGVKVPDWVWRYRWHEDVRMYARRPLKERDYANALHACEYHRVWFSDDHIMDYRVHGFWSHVRTA